MVTFISSIWHISIPPASASGHPVNLIDLKPVLVRDIRPGCLYIYALGGQDCDSGSRHNRVGYFSLCLLFLNITKLFYSVLSTFKLSFEFYLKHVGWSSDLAIEEETPMIFWWVFWPED